MLLCMFSSAFTMMDVCSIGPQNRMRSVLSLDLKRRAPAALDTDARMIILCVLIYDIAQIGLVISVNRHSIK